jgi:hypothetical protein
MGHTVPPLAPIHSSINWRTYGSCGHGPTAMSTHWYVHRWCGTDERNPLYSSMSCHRWMYLIFVGTDDWWIYDLTFIGHIFIGLIYKFVGLNWQIFHNFLYWWLILHLENKKMLWFAVAQCVVKSSILFSDADFAVAQCVVKSSILDIDYILTTRNLTFYDILSCKKCHRRCVSKYLLWHFY